VFISDRGIQKNIKNRNIIKNKKLKDKTVRDRFKNRNIIENEKLKEKIFGE
jgi:hypothetical protein